VVKFLSGQAWCACGAVIRWQGNIGRWVAPGNGVEEWEWLECPRFGRHVPHEAEVTAAPRPWSDEPLF
jgi:hypothetical protein